MQSAVKYMNKQIKVSSSLIENSQEIIEVCFRAKELENAGEYEAATESLGDLWRGIGEKPNLEDFPNRQKQKF